MRTSASTGGFHWDAPLDPGCPDNPLRRPDEPFMVLHNDRPVEIEATVGDTGPCEWGPPEPIYRIKYTDKEGGTATVHASDLEQMWEDPMDAMCGCMDEIHEAEARRHMRNCKRCQEYGAANIGIEPDF